MKKRQHTPGITSLPGISIFIYSIPGWTSEALDWILCSERKNEDGKEQLVRIGGEKEATRMGWDMNPKCDAGNGSSWYSRL